MNPFHLFMIGGPVQMTVVTIFGVIMFYFLYLKIKKMAGKKEFNLKYLNYILVFGSLSFFAAVFIHLIEMMSIMSFIQEKAEVTLTLMAGGYKVSLISPVYGLGYFMVSLTAWGILKEINMAWMK
jgi:hypothetical protein